MRRYGVWFLFHIICWLLAMTFYKDPMETMVGRLMGMATFFGIFFIMPLLKRHLRISIALLCVNAVITTLSLLPHQAGEFNPYLMLILSLLVAEAIYLQPNAKSSWMVGVISAIGITVAMSAGELPLRRTLFIYIFSLFLFAALYLYKNTKAHSDDLDARYDALLSEYRKVKRRSVSDEEMARQEERMLIGHEIHDSVGHKLTALLMQLEVFRLKAADPDKEKIQFLKELANESLEETRRAVKTLKGKEVGGLPGVLRLIRKLEMESFIRTHFSVKYGAFTVPLTGEQSFVIYRSVQEALTNMMKHSKAREAEIIFEAPGGSIFRFEISNPVTDDRRYQEGFGLTSMRERLEKVGGNLEVVKTEEQFIVRGTLKIVGREDDV